MTLWMTYKKDCEDGNFSGPYADWLEATLTTTLRERDEAREMVKELVKEVSLMTAFSNGVSMALRAPGGRSHSWTLGKIKNLYTQQCVVEGVIKKAETMLKALS